jgi:hypothetical protein
MRHPVFPSISCQFRSLFHMIFKLMTFNAFG